MSPSQALDLAEIKNKFPSSELGSLQAIIVGGGSIAPAGVAAVRAALCRNVMRQYGSTEAGVVALSSFDSVSNSAGSYVSALG